MLLAERRMGREIRLLENELPKWNVSPVFCNLNSRPNVHRCLLKASITGVNPPDFDVETLAVLRGRLVRYLMRSQTVTLGRANRRTKVDVDLSLESLEHLSISHQIPCVLFSGPAFKLSRRQVVIKLSPQTGEFSIINEGRVTMYIGGQPLLAQSKTRLDNNAFAEVSRFFWREFQFCFKKVYPKSSGRTCSSCLLRQPWRSGETACRRREHGRTIVAHTHDTTLKFVNRKCCFA